ncbi:hypothetical protein BRD18_00090 [Halobacteriales archaeon SW_7_71_33]|nr:MAG: hypothetical protein BRD18_00090 [Halobacteriales archaeon SW_7_71_33]
MSTNLMADIGVREIAPTYHSDSMDEIPLCLRVATVREYTDESPAVVELSVRNCIDRAVTVMFGMCAPFSELFPTEYDSQSPALVPTSEFVEDRPDEEVPEYLDWDQYRPQSPEDGMWKLTEGFTRLDVGHQLQLAPGERLQNRYELLASPKASEPPTGEFRFRTDYRIDRGEFVQLGEHDLTLGVELTLLLSLGAD